MNSFEYYAPTKIVFGKDAELKTAELIKEFGGRRVAIIYGGKSAVKSGLIARIEEVLSKENLPFITLGGVVPNPLLSTVREMSKKSLEFKADFILAVGGGSVIDSAKAIAHSVANSDSDVWDFYSGKKIVEKSLPVASVLTISAAGSEMSDSSVITNDEEKPPIKIGFNTKFNRCVFSIMNPTLTYTLPKYQLGAGVCDIFMHTVERFFAEIRYENYLSDEIAYSLFRTVVKYGSIIVKEPDNYEAASEIMWAGSISHVGLTGLGCKGNINRQGDWACHQLGMTISAIYDSTHGATLSAVFGAWARYVMDTDIKRFADFARNIYGIKEDDDRIAADKGIALTEEFFKTLGMPISLGELFGKELSDTRIEELALLCSRNKTREIGAFRLLNYDDMYKIYINAK